MTKVISNCSGRRRVGGWAIHQIRNEQVQTSNIGNEATTTDDTKYYMVHNDNISREHAAESSVMKNNRRVV